MAVALLLATGSTARACKCVQEPWAERYIWQEHRVAGCGRVVARTEEGLYAVDVLDRRSGKHRLVVMLDLSHGGSCELFGLGVGSPVIVHLRWKVFFGLWVAGRCLGCSGARILGTGELYPDYECPEQTVERASAPRGSFFLAWLDDVARAMGWPVERDVDAGGDEELRILCSTGRLTRVVRRDDALGGAVAQVARADSEDSMDETGAWHPCTSPARKIRSKRFTRRAACLTEASGDWSELLELASAALESEVHDDDAAGPMHHTTLAIEWRRPGEKPVRVVTESAKTEAQRKLVWWLEEHRLCW